MGQTRSLHKDKCARRRCDKRWAKRATQSHGKKSGWLSIGVQVQCEAGWMAGPGGAGPVEAMGRQDESSLLCREVVRKKSADHLFLLASLS